jgi:hypothetical protein
MGCCGDRRQSYAAQLGGPFARAVVGSRPAGSDVARADAGAADGGTIVFEYVGHTALTVQGPFSGKVYRFDEPGARLHVDACDRGALATVPALREARHD